MNIAACGIEVYPSDIVAPCVFECRVNRAIGGGSIHGASEENRNNNAGDIYFYEREIVAHEGCCDTAVYSGVLYCNRPALMIMSVLGR